ncbi:hypothetical protein LTSEMIS_0496 [Salmonella enterica subsp. enterica serovar Mississippi str. A4-633]|nr:hypothetical protein LTSEMIS_0496 [Salmonella enterica subsp. enterica serovar Mississippi str. A4-633]
MLKLQIVLKTLFFCFAVIFITAPAVIERARYFYNGQVDIAK